MEEPLKATVIEKTEGFAALEEEWRDLYRHSPTATPFQSWEWLYSWWEHYGGEGYRLRLITLRSGEGLLVGLIPLMAERRRGLRRLLFVGTRTAYLDIVAREGWEGGVAEAGARALWGESGSWGIADLQELRPEALAWKLFDAWDGPKTRAWKNYYMVVEVKPWEELLESVSRSLRKKTRQTLRKAESDGVRPRLAGESEAERAARTLVELHREAWRGRDIDPRNLTPAFEEHMVAAVRRMTSGGLGAVCEFWRDGEVVTSEFMVFGGDFVGTYVVGASREAIKRYQWSSLWVWQELSVARARNVPRVSHLRGEEPYKLRWNPRKVPNHRMILGRKRATWRMYLAYVRARSRYSEDAPDWLKDVVNRLRR
jgi:CelD/BcsL family acetyltransferase involved in cellulose biosynthesis